MFKRITYSPNNLWTLYYCNKNLYISYFYERPVIVFSQHDLPATSSMNISLKESVGH